jgi:hypothetical protein
VKKARAEHGKSKIIETEKGETGEGKSQEQAQHFFLHHHKEFILEGQTVNSTYYCDTVQRLLENVQRHHPKLW